jgi:hypothetical protein
MLKDFTAQDCFAALIWKISLVCRTNDINRVCSVHTLLHIDSDMLINVRLKYRAVWFRSTTNIDQPTGRMFLCCIAKKFDKEMMAEPVTRRYVPEFAKSFWYKFQNLFPMNKPLASTEWLVSRKDS